MPKKRSYSVEYKVRALDWYHENGENKHKTAKEFDVDPKRIREWTDQEDRLRGLMGTGKGRKICNLHQGAEFSIELDMLILDYLMDEREEGKVVTNDMLKMKALEVAPGIEDIPDDFVAS